MTELNNDANNNTNEHIESKPESNNANLRWYVVQVPAGKEKAAEQNIRFTINNSSMVNLFGRILIPAEEVQEIRNGHKIMTERRFYPGYLLLEMELNDETWYLIRNTKLVTAFVSGKKSHPIPISQAEVEKIFQQIKSGSNRLKHKIEFEIGEIVRVKEGALSDFTGNIEDVNYEKNKLKVSVNIFGRATLVELDFHQVARL